MEANINTVKTIGTSVLVVSEERDNRNMRRTDIILTNTSTGGQIISIAIDNDAVAGNGIVLNPSGNWQASESAGYHISQRPITAISSLAGGTLAIRERVMRGTE